MVPEINIHKPDDAAAGRPAPLNPKWASLACLLLALAFFVAPLIYLTGNLRDAFGALAYDLADFLSGPLWAASLVVVFLALRERLAECGSRRMSLAFAAAILAAAAMVLVACLRSANRHYHIAHPELHLEDSIEVLVVWTTLIAGVTAAGWHFLGWGLVLVGWTGWSSGLLGRGFLSQLYLFAGVVSLFVYRFPELEGAAAGLGVIWALWQGLLFWKAGP